MAPRPDPPTLAYARPADPPPRTVADVQWFLLSPTGWPLAVAAVVPAGLATLGDPIADLAAFFGLLGCAAIWVVNVVLRLSMYRRAAATGPVHQPVWRWFVVPAIWLVAAVVYGHVLSGPGTPSATLTVNRFIRTQPTAAMERAAVAALAAPNTPQPTITISGCPPVAPEVCGAEVYLLVKNGLDGSEYADQGYIYSPAGPPTDWGNCQHLTGPWYWGGHTW